MERLRTLIADDEPLARDRLRAMLRDEPGVEIVAECGSGPETIAAVRAHQPDLVLLDLNMPGCDGLAAMAKFSPENRPVVVFVTAHERHAVEAFAIGAVDYLLKPFDRDRLRVALSRAAQQLTARRASDLTARVKRLLAERSPPPARPERLAVRSRGRVVFVAAADIARIEAANNYAVLHLLDGENLRVRESLSTLEMRLASGRFVRVNRSTLIPLDQIAQLKCTTYGDYVVVLRDGMRLPLSRGFRGQFERFASVGS